ncbi:30S ribosomal protein S2 [bacterium]|nr:MAG: 30S ribosomal protein S2 [bacterium]
MEIANVSFTIADMVNRGIHLGHPRSQWNPKMAPYIYTNRLQNEVLHDVCIINLYSTIKQLSLLSDKLSLYSSQNKTFLFVGTKRQASEILANLEGVGSSLFYVNQRWLGGMLTNWQTIKKSLETLEKLETQESQGAFLKLPKKEATLLKKRKERLHKYLGGLKGMKNLPDVVIILGQKEEMNAVLECKKLGITTISILDTDCDPTLTDLFVVANDDSKKSLDFLCTIFLKSISLGRKKVDES